MYGQVLASQDNNVLTMHCVKLAVSRFNFHAVFKFLFDLNIFVLFFIMPESERSLIIFLSCGSLIVLTPLKSIQQKHDKQQQSC